MIHPNSVLESSELGAGCLIGPYARVRPGSKLGAGVHIGNFVELKKTVIADGSKANHLTYLGDAIIGKGVNVGAGTITCNYDGVNKSTTTIEDGAFIGSGNMLVAPVRIGKDATTGAGSTISKEAPDGKLTLARAKQTTIEGWKRPEKKDKEKRSSRTARLKVPNCRRSSSRPGRGGYARCRSPVPRRAESRTPPAGRFSHPPTRCRSCPRDLRHRSSNAVSACRGAFPCRRMSMSLPPVRPPTVDQRTRNPCARSGNRAFGIGKCIIARVRPANSTSSCCHGMPSGTGIGARSGRASLVDVRLARDLAPRRAPGATAASSTRSASDLPTTMCPRRGPRPTPRPDQARRRFSADARICASARLGLHRVLGLQRPDHGPR